MGGTSCSSSRGLTWPFACACALCLTCLFLRANGRCQDVDGNKYPNDKVCVTTKCIHAEVDL